ncbi:hypothetical protein Slin15195_G122590 [Septoria linicola]|uniref:2EXR domain-containing protein n=1 Tax=Septoria linicola TaxID=215465 RepID=A0A9Q9B1I2_9PEZI|nr:hypothetical protein Slin14017_G078790 [Septoria linicola]USW58940.1 hypothetical protein Slin15195_G122590 [Septoria linicola]
MELPQPDESATTCFFDLPPELRNRVYELTLGDTETITIRDYRMDKPSTSYTKHVFEKDSASLHTAASLLRASRQSHAEFGPVFYGAYNFYFHVPGIAGTWARQIGDSITHVRKVEILLDRVPYKGSRCFRLAEMPSWIALAHGAHNLQCLALPWVWVTNASGVEANIRARALSKAVLPLCTNILRRRKMEAPHTDLSNVLAFLRCNDRDYNAVERLEVEARIRPRLETMLRTPQEQLEFEAEVLQDMQYLFIDQEDENTETST